MKNKVLYVQHFKPALSIIVMALFGSLLLLVDILKLVGIIWIILCAIIFVLLKDHIIFVITENYIKIFQNSERSVYTIIYKDEIKSWCLSSNGKDFDNVVLNRNTGKPISIPAMYPTLVVSALRKMMKEKEIEKSTSYYSKDDIDILSSIKKRINKLKDKVSK